MKKSIKGSCFVMVTMLLLALGIANVTPASAAGKSSRRHDIATQIVTLSSIASQDGWALESSQTSGIGGTINSSAPVLNLGDDVHNKQYRSILSFQTDILPDDAIIISVTLQVKRQGAIGVGDPVNLFHGFIWDISTGYFGTSAILHITDFQAPASGAYGPASPSPVRNIYSINLNKGKDFINKLTTGRGLTQIRLAFYHGDNNNGAANILSLYSGDTALEANRPKLVITYTLPPLP